jgi:pSer/pThr/pTyr-binding forkhead associated (FHA) protein
MSAIVLTLLHPGKNVPLQNWTFDTESVIRIGRSTDNDVVLYSAVVSRHHLEIKRNGRQWEVESFGANGTYVNGKPITKIPVEDGTVVRLASSGPQIQIRLGIEQPEPKPDSDRAQKIQDKNAVSAEAKKTSKERMASFEESENLK